MPSDPNILQGEFAINGSFGTLEVVGGRSIAEIQRFEGTLDVGRRDIMRAGSRGQTYKAMTVTGTGSMNMLKVTTEFFDLVSELIRGGSRQLQRQLTLKVTVDDPEALGVEQYRVWPVKLWNIGFGFAVNEIIEQAIPFTFEEIEFIRKIAGDPTASLHASRYVALD
jgi:hypothetical protein